MLIPVALQAAAMRRVADSPTTIVQCCEPAQLTSALSAALKCLLFSAASGHSGTVQQGTRLATDDIDVERLERKLRAVIASSETCIVNNAFEVLD